MHHLHLHQRERERARENEERYVLTLVCHSSTADVCLSLMPLIDASRTLYTVLLVRRYGENITAVCAEQDKLGARAMKVRGAFSWAFFCKYIKLLFKSTHDCSLKNTANHNTTFLRGGGWGGVDLVHPRTLQLQT